VNGVRVRAALADSALRAGTQQPWAETPLTRIARGAGVSLADLRRAVGDRPGLARLIVDREVEGFVTDVDRALAEVVRAGGGTADCLAAAAGQILHHTHRNPLLRAAFTGDTSDPQFGVLVAAAGEPTPVDLVDGVCRAVTTALAAHVSMPPAVLAEVCEQVVRLALSHVVAPTRHRDGPCAQIERAGTALITALAAPAVAAGGPGHARARTAA
jgi:AcrR family transcriptional regulator